MSDVSKLLSSENVEIKQHKSRKHFISTGIAILVFIILYAVIGTERVYTQSYTPTSDETITPLSETLTAVATIQDENYRLWLAGQGALLQDQNENLALALAFEGVSVAQPPIGAQSIFYAVAGDSRNNMTLTTEQNEPIFYAAFSPDGKTIASAGCGQRDDSSRCTKGKIKLWDAVSGELLYILRGHTETIIILAFSPDGNILASGSWDKTIQLWDMTTRQTLHTLKVHKNIVFNVLSMAFTPNSKTLAVAIGEDIVRLWDVQTGQILKDISPECHNTVTDVAFNSDGTRIALGNCHGAFSLLDVETGQELKWFWEFYRASNIAFSPDRYTVASTARDWIRLWSLSTGELEDTLHGHDEGVWDIAFSPDGKYLASAGGRDGTVRLWNHRAGEQLEIFTGHTGDVHEVVFSPDGKTLMSSSSTEIKLWDIRPQLKILEGHTANVTSIVFSPDGKVIASASYDGSVQLWDIATGEVLKTFRGHRDFVLSVAYSPDDSLIASGSCGELNDSDQCIQGEIKMWNVATGQEHHTLNGGLGSIREVAFSPDGQYLASASCGLQDDSNQCIQGEIKVWNVVTEDEILTLSGHSNYVETIEFSPDGRSLASGSRDNSIIFWDLATGGELFTIEGHRDTVNSIAFSPDGTTLVSASCKSNNSRGFCNAGEIKLWDIASQTEILTLEGHSSEVNDVAFSPDGQLIASASFDRSINLWDVSTGQLILTLFEHDSQVITSVAFSPDGTLLASGSAGHTVEIRNIRSLPLMRQWVQENRYIREFTCEERSRFTMPVQCDIEGNFPTRTPYPTPSPIPLPSWTPFWTPLPTATTTPLPEPVPLIFLTKTAEASD